MPSSNFGANAPREQRRIDDVGYSNADLISAQAATLCYERADEFLTWLKNRPEKSIAVVAHWVFLKHLFTAHASDKALATNFRNAELRTAALFTGGGKVEL